ncbi:MAG: nitroreductase family protein, partial [Deltaproteobacteria bacterium]|nr:nitroreductase family protein [Deltaproteobacteria bacterium]
MDDRLRTFYELYDRRRSVRAFENKAIEPEKIARLLNILQRAQSAANRQPWHFIVTENENREALNACLTKDGFKAAPLLITACADPKEAWVRKSDNRNYAWVDVTIALTEMIGAA